MTFTNTLITPRYAEEVAYFLSLPLYRFVNELETCNAKYTRGLATHLGLPTRYANGQIKSRDVLAAAIFEYFRQARKAVA